MCYSPCGRKELGTTEQLTLTYLLNNMFEKHYNLAKEAGLNVGAYFYVAPVPLVKAEDTAAACLDIAWKIPWTEEPGGLQSMKSQRVGYD